jgi:glycosyltransferase involved in cell wall biosynthesis
MLTDHLPHGDGLVAHGFIREMGTRGHELHVAAAGLDIGAELPEPVHVHRLTQPGEAVPGRLRVMRKMRTLARVLSREAPFDLVHQLNPVDVGVSLAVAGLGAPVVLGPYVPDWAPSGPGADKAASAAALRAKRVLRAAQQRRAATVLLSTQAARSKLEAWARPRVRVREVSPGIDERAWLPQPDRIPAQDVLFLANLEVRKGVHVLLDAFERVAPRLARARLLVAGTGPELDSVRRRVAGLGPGRVELLGQVERERVPALMRECDVYCLPSYGEPFGMTALEAMACARPVVATAAGGLAHLVPEGAGRLVAPGDAAALAAALEEVLADPARARGMGELGRAEVERRYSWSRVGDRLVEVYAEAARERRRSRWS